MKKIFLLLIATAFFTACNDDHHSSYPVSIATVENPNGNTYFDLKTDRGNVLKVTETSLGNYKPPTGQRILAEYSILEKEEATRSVYDIKLRDAYSILTKDIFSITPEKQDSIGHDPVGINQIWAGGDFLNVRFYYKGYNKTHFITLAKEVKDPKDGKVYLEFRHNAHKDTPHYIRTGLVCFNLKSLQSLTTGDFLDLVIVHRGYDNREHTYNLTYKFGENSGVEADLDKADLDEIRHTEFK